ncbi:MAG: HEXXH motif-containing putative peptide modification protein, partial [Pseudomonadota bacterium]
MTKMQTVAGTPAADFSFFPDPARAIALDGAMHDALAESLRHLAEHLSPEEATGPDHVAGLIEGGARLRPTAFGHYFELAFALLHEDAATATTSATALTAERPAPKGLRIGHMGGGEEDALYLRRLGGSNFDFLPPEPEMAAAFEERFAAGRALLSAEVPELAGEIDAIVREVRLATGDPEAPMQFDGGSAYQLWGLLLLNPRFHPDPLAVAEVLAHEAGHLLLFGFTIDEPLARNPDEDLFPSPLRVDPRPMDGIYHAT